MNTIKSQQMLKNMLKNQQPPVNLGRVSPQAKMVQVNDNMGNSGIKNQQGATRSLYDSIKLEAGKNIYDFFQSPNTALPNKIGTNVDAQNGLLGVGETMTVNWIHWLLFLYDPTKKEVTELGAVSQSPTATPSMIGGFYAGNFEVYTNNNRTLKPIDLAETLPAFNPSDGATALLEKLNLFTEQVIPPLLPWIVRVQIPAFTLPSTGEYYLRCTVTGSGSLLNVKQNF